LSEEQQKLPKEWISAKLGDIAPSGGTRNLEVYGDKEFYYVDIEAVDNIGQKIVNPKRISRAKAPSRARMAIEAGDIIFSLVRPYLRNIAIVPEELNGQVASTAYCVMRPAQGILSSFIFYSVLRDDFINSIATYGNSPPSGHDDEFLAMSIPLAPTNEQRHIVSAIEQQFTRIDAAAAALIRVQTKLKRYRAAVLKAAVEGKLTESWRAEHPATESASQLLEQILNERRTRWEADLRAKGKDPAKVKYIEPAKPDTENLPELPEAWCWVVVGQLLIESPCNGISIKGSDTPPGVPALRLSAMSESGFDYDDRRYIPISEDVAESLAIREGDYFVSRGNGSLHFVGRGTFAQKPPERIVFPDTMIRLRFVNVGLLRNFIACIWSSAFMRTQIETKAHTTAGIYKISQPNVESFILPLPPILEQEQIVAEVERRLSVVAQLEAIIQTNLKRAERLRQSILREAFAGRLVPQDSDDEPASVLLERIRKERDRRKKETASNGRYVHVFDEPVQKINVEETQQTGLWESVGGARIDKEYIS